MPWQLIYTSAPRGLLSGQSGFCTVARSGDLREALAQRLEQISSYHYLRVAEATVANRNPTVSAYRVIDLRGTRYYVLTRIQPCGLDFTARTNHLAHHLVFQAGELGQLPSPAVILRYWPGWLSSWQGDPRLLDDPALPTFVASSRYCLPADNWLRLTGDAGRAAGILETDRNRNSYLVCPEGSELDILSLYCESLQLLNISGQYPVRPWRHTFTSFLQGEDNPADFQWRACQEGTPAYQQAAGSGAKLVALNSVRVPANSLVKVAREGYKAPVSAPVSAPSDVKSNSTEIPVPGKAVPSLDDDPWKDVDETPDDGGFRLSITSGTLVRIGLFVLVLGALVAMRFWLPRKSTTPPSATAAHIPPATSPSPPAKEPPPPSAPLDPAQLSFLSGDGPTYVMIESDFASFSIPLDANVRLQKLINRYDKLETLPNHIQMSMDTDDWGFAPGATMTVNSRQLTVLSAISPTGVECSLDYSNWKSDDHNPLLIRTTFATPPKAFALRFSFSTAEDGDPFRLLFVNQNGPPAPRHLGLQWLRLEQSGAVSLQPPLRDDLLGNFILPGEWRWQFWPFIKTISGRAAFLYKDWPTRDLPATGDELDFAQAKEKLAAHLKPLEKKRLAVAKKITAQSKAVDLTVPLASVVGVTESNLASFAIFGPKPGPSDFLVYLNHLRKKVGAGKWPSVADGDDEGDLAIKFQEIHDYFVGRAPAMTSALTVGGTNYFSAVWKNLKDADVLREERQKIDGEVDKLRGRLSLVPETLDQVAYVGLFIVNPPKPDVEVIRFEHN